MTYQLDTSTWPATYGQQAKPRMGFFTDTSVSRVSGFSRDGDARAAGAGGLGLML
ncbi:MAG: hypothetical protein ACYC91_19950 [Solirubrobacteraceae bacterium]